MESQINERTDIAPLFEFNWMEMFKPIRRIQMMESKQSKKEKGEGYQPFSRIVWKQRNNKRYRNKYSTYTRTLPGKTESPTDTITSTKQSGNRIREAYFVSSEELY